MYPSSPVADEEEGLGRQKEAMKSHITVNFCCVLMAVPSHNEIHGFSFDLSINNITETAHAKRNFPMHLKLAVPIPPSHPTPPPSLPCHRSFLPTLLLDSQCDHCLPPATSPPQDITEGTTECCGSLLWARAGTIGKKSNANLLKC